MARSDADTVFGAIYAQAEDDFNRIERNYLNGLGWLAQAEGESAVYSDLRARLFVDTDDLQRRYRESPQWLKTLMLAWSDGLNYFLAETSGRKAKGDPPFRTLDGVVLHRRQHRRRYRDHRLGAAGEILRSAQPAPPGRRVSGARGTGSRANATPPAAQPFERTLRETPPGGSNGFAIAPGRSASGHALLWINPHTSYYFRSELQMVSEQGLNVYGAVTWGQFFVYQGFNAHNGWMHTSYGGDAIDEYAETIVKKPDGLYYEYGGALRKLQGRAGSSSR